VYDYSDDLEEIKANIVSAGLTEPEERTVKYHEREGDLLLLILLRRDAGYKDKTYFLTANTKDSIRGSEELQTIIDISQFSQDHILEKGTDAENVLSDIIKDLPTFKIQNKYRTQIDVLRKHLTEEDINEFIQMMKYYDKNKVREFVFFLRKLLDNILHHIAFLISEPDAEYWNPKNKKQLQAKSFIKGFKGISGAYQGLPEFDKKHHIGYNSIIQNACLSIFEITSDCGIHDISKAIDIESLNTLDLSKFTLSSLLGQICDVILWYDKAMTILTTEH